MVWLAAGTSQAQSTPADQLLPSPQVLSRYGLERMWWGQGVLNPSRDRVHFLHADEDSVYVQSSNGTITAFDAESGQRRWAVRLGKFDAPTFRIATNEDQATIVAGSFLCGLDKFSGRTLWRIRLPSQPSTSPVIDDEQVYLGMLDGSVYAFSLKRIRELQAESRLPEWTNDALVWRFRSSAELTSPPVLFDTRICFANRKGDVYGVTKSTRELVFQFETNAGVVTPISRRGELLFVATEQKAFYALKVKPRADMAVEQKSTKTVHSPLMKRDLESGKIAWEFTSGLPIRQAPIGMGSDLFLIPDRGGFYCLDAQTGVKKWWQPDAERFVAATAGFIYASDEDQNLVIISRQDGQIVGRLPMRRFDMRLANVRTDRLVLATSRGYVLVLREKGRTVPTFHTYPDRLPLMPEFESEDGEKKSGDDATEPESKNDDSAAPEST
ncbi:MAG: PQQ-binding-like beta-propeller repeat protein [Planctomycetaceae bacterium]